MPIPNKPLSSAAMKLIGALLFTSTLLITRAAVAQESDAGPSAPAEEVGAAETNATPSSGDETDSPGTPPGPDASVPERQKYWYAVDLPAAEPPPGIEHRPSLSDRARREKRSQKPFGVIYAPQLGGSLDSGFIVGAVTAMTWNGSPDDNRFFDYAPYEQQISVMAQVGLKRRPGVLARQTYLTKGTFPYINGTLFSITAEGNFFQNASTLYFGNNADTMGDLRSLAPSAIREGLTGGQVASFGSYQERLEQTDDSNRTYAKYHVFKYTEPRATVTAKYELFGGLLTPAATLNLGYIMIDKFGEQELNLPGVEKLAVSNRTKLEEDCANSALDIHGCEGDWNNTLRLSLVYDARDYAPDPDSGVLVDASNELALTFLGTPSYRRHTFSASFYVNPLDLAGVKSSWFRMVVAGRVVYSMMYGSEIPFWSLSKLSFFERTTDGLGGILTMRGYRQARFVGKVLSLANLELRCDFLTLRSTRSSFTFKLVPFVDAGRSFDEPGETSLKDWRLNAGAGLYFQWNQSNIIHADMGIGDEGIGGGINFGYMY